MTPTAQTDIEIEHDDDGLKPPMGEETVASVEPSFKSQDYGSEVDSYLPAQTKFNKLWAYSKDAHDDQKNGVANEVAEVKPIRQTTSKALASEWSKPSTDLLLAAPEGGITSQEMEETAEDRDIIIFDDEEDDI